MGLGSVWHMMVRKISVSLDMRDEVHKLEPLKAWRTYDHRRQMKKEPGKERLLAWHKIDHKQRKMHRVLGSCKRQQLGKQERMAWELRELHTP
jgi:hypothetical protein